MEKRFLIKQKAVYIVGNPIECNNKEQNTNETKIYSINQESLINVVKNIINKFTLVVGLCLLNIFFMLQSYFKISFSGLSDMFAELFDTKLNNIEFNVFNMSDLFDKFKNIADNWGIELDKDFETLLVSTNAMAAIIYLVIIGYIITIVLSLSKKEDKEKDEIIKIINSTCSAAAIVLNIIIILFANYIKSEISKDEMLSYVGGVSVTIFPYLIIICSIVIAKLSPTTKIEMSDTSTVQKDFSDSDTTELSQNEINNVRELLEVIKYFDKFNVNETTYDYALVWAGIYNNIGTNDFHNYSVDEINNLGKKNFSKGFNNLDELKNGQGDFTQEECIKLSYKDEKVILSENINNDVYILKNIHKISNLGNDLYKVDYYVRKVYPTTKFVEYMMTSIVKRDETAQYGFYLLECAQYK